MGIIVDKTRTKEGQMRPYIRRAPWFIAEVMILLFVGIPSQMPDWMCIAWTTLLFIGLDVTYTAFRSLLKSSVQNQTRESSSELAVS